MTAPVFLAPADSLAAAAPGGVVLLAGPEGRHAAQVRRLREGEALDLVDGLGRRVHGEVAGPPRFGELDVRVRQVTSEPPAAVRVTVVVALIKGDRFEDAAVMLTEAGADAIVPWAAARSIVRWSADKQARAQQRLAAAVAEAGKQSRRARFPDVGPLVGTAGAVAAAGSADAAFVLHEAADSPLSAATMPATGEVVLVIGPEGGITDDELAAFAGAGAAVVGLGPTVLRAATAAVSACTVTLAMCGRWRAAPALPPGGTPLPGD